MSPIFFGTVRSLHEHPQTFTPEVMSLLQHYFRARHLRNSAPGLVWDCTEVLGMDHAHELLR